MHWDYNYFNCFDRWPFTVFGIWIHFDTGLFNYCTCGHCGQWYPQIIHLSVRSLITYFISIFLILDFFSLLA